MADKQYYIYIICNKRNGTLYTGVTSNLIEQNNPNWNDLYQKMV